MVAERADPDRIDELPPSCGYVIDALADAGGSLHRQELISELRHCERTIDEALRTLESRGYLRRDRDSDDLRQTVAHLAEEHPLITPDSDS
jgi:DNA-binding MarR family transcriptional regulator